MICDGKIISDCKRLGFQPMFRHSDSLEITGALSAVRCFGIFGSGDKIQTDETTQTGASEESVLAAGMGSVASREGDALNLAASNAVVNKSDGVALGGANNRTNIGGFEVTGTNTGSITYNGAAGAEEIAKTFSATIQQINDTASADKIDAQKLVGDALQKVSLLSESKQTEGVTALGRLALWALALILAGFIVWKWKK